MPSIETFVKKFANDWSINLVSMLTYNLITAIFPILLAILTAASTILGILAPQAFASVVSTLQHSLPGSLRAVINVHALLKSLIHSSGPLAFASAATLIWGGSNVFGSMENAFSNIFRTADRDFLRQKLMAVGMMIILATLLPLSLAASSLIIAGSRAFRAVLPPPLGLVLSEVGPLTSLAILWALFLIISIVVPNMTVPFRAAWRGAVAATVLFAMVQLLFPLYITVALSGNQKYGALAASLLVLVAWLWFFALATIIGAQITAVAMGIKPTNYDLVRTLCEAYWRSMIPVPQRQRDPAGPADARDGLSPHVGV
jgi:membrane protein